MENEKVPTPSAQENAAENLDEVLDSSGEEQTEEKNDEPVVEEQPLDAHQEEQLIGSTLVSAVLGFVNFDTQSAENTTTGALVSAERRKLFRRDVYVSIKDTEQNVEFLGRVVEGPFHTPHEIGGESAITRTTILHPERTKFRPSYFVDGTIEILGRLVGGERISPTATRPRPYSEISIFPPDRLQTLLEISGDVLLGHLMGYEEEKIEVRADPNNKSFLPRNVGIFGTIGSGKSNTTQVLIEEATKAGWAVVAIDVEGEYVQMNQPTDHATLSTILSERFGQSPAGIRDFRVYVPSSGGSDAVEPIAFKVPIARLSNDIIYDIQEFSEPQQRMFERIIAHIRRTSRPAASNLGALASANGEKQFVEHLRRLKAAHPTETELGDDIDNLISKYTNPRRESYTLQQLIDGLSDSAFLSSIQAFERNTASALSSKLISIGRSQMLDWNSNLRVDYLPIDDLLVGGRLSVIDVSETDDRSRNIAIAHVLQSLFEKVIETPEGETIPGTTITRPKILVVIEEVHSFVSRQSVSKMRAVLDNLQTISRRGRKRWMSLALVSQQPGHVPDELFELANTRFIHQLKSASNLAPVRQTTGGVHEALWSTVPTLGQGECLLTGSVFKNPIFVNIRPAKSKRLYTT